MWSSILNFCLFFLNSIELRELEKKLKAAYMNKERAAQIAEKDAIKHEQMVIMFLVIMFSIFLASFRKSTIDQFFENCYIL